jgi:hypothetical protein
MSERLASRDPQLEWAQRSAANELEGLAWADGALETDALPYQQMEEEPNDRSFRHMPYAAFLPPSVAEAALLAQSRGRVTAHEGLQLIFARLEWLVASRRYLWSPLSPVPRLLAYLVEAFGVDPPLHGDRPEVLSRLAAYLPRWHPLRGRVDKALELLAEADTGEEPLAVAHVDQDGPAPDKPAIRDEVLRCRSADWWRRRRQDGAQPSYRIHDGLVLFQPDEGPVFELQQEDVLVEWDPDKALSRNLMRLLPAWAEFRLSITRS